MNAPRSNGPTSGISSHDSRTGPAAEARADGAGGQERKLSHRDWILLPFVGLLTVVFVAGSTEFIARRMFSQSGTLMRDCLLSHPAISGRAIPNSVCWDKPAESPSAVEYRFNVCGHRAGVECGPKPDGVYRIVMIGSSVAMGDRVRWDKTFAVSLPEVLSRQTGRKVELYNEGVMIRYPHVVAQQVQEALAAKPDMLLWVLTPFDIETETPDRYIEIPAENTSTLTRAWSRAKITFSNQSFSESMSYLWQRALEPLNKSTTTTMLQHFLYESESQYVKSCLLGGDPMGYLLARPSDKWEGRLRMFDSDDAEIARQARAAGVPLVSVLVPMRPQAAILSTGSWPAGYDPYKLGNELRAITTSHGGIYLDIFPGFREIPNSEQFYFPVDGHPNADGHAIISRLLAKELTNGSIPALKTATPPPAE